MIENIKKRSGNVEKFQAEKINRWGQWAANTLGDAVDWSHIVMRATSGNVTTIDSQELQLRLINLCLEEETWSYYRMAGRLYAPFLYKHIFNRDQDNLPTIKEVHRRLELVGLMRTLDYSDEEYAEIERHLDHTLDFEEPHFALHQIRTKYALRNRVSGQEYETPQYVYMRMAMALAEDEAPDVRMEHLLNWYELFSEKSLSAPTPNYVNLGTHHAGYASCCIYSTNDNIDSLAVGDHIAYKMTAMSAGIGSHITTRSLLDPVRGGAIEHQGRGPYYRALEAMIKANLQNGRGGAATAYYEFFNPDMETIARYKNPMSTEDRKIRGIDYAMQSNRFLAGLARQRKQMFTFNVHTAPDLYRAFYEEDVEEFERLYRQYEADPSFEKNYVDAREALLVPLNEAVETGRHYLMWVDEMNRHTPHKDPIRSSNLCVAPETKILTDQGYKEIQSVSGTSVKVWNGEEFSAVDVVKTGEDQELLVVMTDNGSVLECTPYHKFYVVDGYGMAPREVRAVDLEAGDKLIKFDFPVIDGSESLDKAYVNGFYSGDGTEEGGSQVVYLYGDKRSLAEEFPGGSEWSNETSFGRMRKRYSDLKSKFFVPDASYTLAARLEWLAGYADADGCIYRNGDNQQLVMASVDYTFMERVKEMLETMGVSPKLRSMRGHSVHSLPKNDGSGEYADYNTQPLWRLIVNSVDLQVLMDLGFSPKRLTVTKHQPQRSAKRFVQVSGVVNLGRRDDTYCFTEPKRHMGVFNGLLTGQCTETGFPSAPYDSMMDLYSTEDHGRGEIGLCSLGAVVISRIRDRDHHKKVVYYALRMIDKCIHQATYSLPHLSMTAKARMNAGVGMMGLAHYMAERNLSYSSDEGKREIHRVAERHMYLTIEASLELGREFGNAPWMHKTKWPEGWMPIDTYNRNVDTICDFQNEEDWEDLRGRVIENKGIRNSSLVNYMPGESSSKAVGETNSIYPVRRRVLVKTDDNVSIRWAAPHGDNPDYHYESAWDIPMMDMIQMYAIIQKWTDQSISADTFRIIRGNAKVASTDLLKEYFAKTFYGHKTGYYSNSATASGKKLDGSDESTQTSAPQETTKAPTTQEGNVVGIERFLNPAQTTAETSAMTEAAATTDDTSTITHNGEELVEMVGVGGCGSGGCSL